MTNPMFNPQPNYSGVTIQISNPAVNVGGNCCAGYPNQVRTPFINGGYVNGYNNQAVQNKLPQNGNYISYPQGSYGSYAALPSEGINQNLPQAAAPADGQVADFANPDNGYGQYGMTNPTQQGIAPAYPAQYYMNNYNYNGDNREHAHNSSGQEPYGNSSGNNGNGFVNGHNQTDFTENDLSKQSEDIADNNSRYTDKNIQSFADDNAVKNFNHESAIEGNSDASQNGTPDYQMNSYKMYADKNAPKDTDMTRSKTIIGDLDEREAEIEEEKKNTKETKIVALTDEYIKSLENYLNNPNDEIRLMASKEVLTRLDEDKDRYNDAALNALLNKMMQDPNKLVRIA